MCVTTVLPIQYTPFSSKGDSIHRRIQKKNNNIFYNFSSLQFFFLNRRSYRVSGNDWTRLVYDETKIHVYKTEQKQVVC